MIADVPLGAFLSGGIDSSLVVALMQKAAKGKTRTFTIGFDEPDYDEAPFARRVASHLGTEHAEQYIGQREVFDIVPRLPQIYDEPIGDSSQIPMILVAQMARREVTVCLSGDGGDELFGGYNHYRWGPRVGFARTVLPDGLAPLAGASLEWVGRCLGRQRLTRMGEVLGAPSADESMRLLNAAIPNVRGIWTGGRYPQGAPDLPGLPGMHDRTTRLMAFDLHGFLPDDILAKVDRATMSVGLESRAPFLDDAIAKFAWSMPANLRAAKVVLKELLARFVPRPLFERPKSGFGLPLDRWFRGELKTMAEKYLIHSAPRYAHLLNSKRILQLWNEHQCSRFNRQRELWVLMSLMMWLETYVG
jgi:asparagine synthase (glutamine-hydrolysing)